MHDSARESRVQPARACSSRSTMRERNQGQYLVSGPGGGVLPIVGHTGRLRSKLVPFLG